MAVFLTSVLLDFLQYTRFFLTVHSLGMFFKINPADCIYAGQSTFTALIGMGAGRASTRLDGAGHAR